MGKRIFVFGDSITYGCYDVEGGWVQRLRKYLDSSPKNYRVYNLGNTLGDTTKNILKRFESETKARSEGDDEDKNIIIFAIGINDSEFSNNKKCFVTEIKAFKENILKLIELGRKFSSEIIFVGLTAVDDSKVDPIPWFAGYSYRNEYIERYNEIIKQTCKERKIHFIEIFERWMKFDYKNLLDDGVHPNSKGHEKLFETIKDYLIENKII